MPFDTTHVGPVYFACNWNKTSRIRTVVEPKSSASNPPGELWTSLTPAALMWSSSLPLSQPQDAEDSGGRRKPCVGPGRTNQDTFPWLPRPPPPPHQLLIVPSPIFPVHSPSYRWCHWLLWTLFPWKRLHLLLLLLLRHHHHHHHRSGLHFRQLSLPPFPSPSPSLQSRTSPHALPPRPPPQRAAFHLTAERGAWGRERKRGGGGRRTGWRNGCQQHENKKRLWLTHRYSHIVAVVFFSFFFFLFLMWLQGVATVASSVNEEGGESCKNQLATVPPLKVGVYEYIYLFLMSARWEAGLLSKSPLVSVF